VIALNGLVKPAGSPGEHQNAEHFSLL
jgi:hypothetical protein